MNPQELREQCTHFFSGHPPSSPAEEYAAMARWCEQHKAQHDTYGEGALIQDLEQKVADLLGFESALFFITGTQAQTIALRIACEQRGSQRVALHPSAHILMHERSNYQFLEHFKTVSIGDPFRPWNLADLQGQKEHIGAVSYELPMREIGGQLPEWEALEQVKQYCREQDIHLHMDGARLWEAAAGYARSAREIAAGFDSVYVSLYKGIGGLGGAMLCGSAAFIAQARTWMVRMGGNVYRRSPFIVAAAMRFDEKIAAMPAYFRRTEWLYAELAGHPQLRVNPSAPQSNMLHVYFPVERERLTAIRDWFAKEHKVWLFGGARHAALPQQSYVEWYVGDGLLTMPDQQVRDMLAALVQQLAPTA
jgi:threonine aldolase